MDPFTIALATFGVQKLRGKSTGRALRDAVGLATLGQVGGMAGVPGLQSFGTMGNFLPGQTLGQQFMQTGPMRGIGALMGKTPATQPTLPPTNEFGETAAQIGENLPKAKNPTLLSKFSNLSPAAKVGIGAAAIPLLGGLFGGDDKETTYLPTPNQAYSKFAKSGLPGTPTGFYVRDYAAGEDVAIADPSSYRTVEDVLGDQPTQNYKAVEMNQGGLASIARFNEGGQVLPSKFTHDENDINNYQRANGFVMDGTGNGKDHEDTMLAQLADGEFVSRSHAVLGAGIIAGASIKDKKEQREKGAKFFYEQQKRFKRIFDIVNANKTEH